VTAPLTGGPPRVLVIGASGFLGGHVRDRAAAAGLDVVTAGRSALPGSPSHCRIDLADGDTGGLARTLSQQAPDVVINCAGATGGDVAALAAANVTGTAALVTALRQTGRAIRLVHLGSAAEYGPGQPGIPVDEATPARPASAYGATKLAGTRLVELGRATGLDAVVLRVFNPVGPGAPESILPGRVAGQLRRAAGGGTVRLGALDAVRDFVDARDVADAAVAAALAPVLPAAVINIGSGTATPVADLVDALVEISGHEGPVTSEAGARGEQNSGEQARDEQARGEQNRGEQAPRDGPRGPAGRRSWQQADISRARRDLDWQPRRGLSTALADLWAESRAA
jgi:nucleoside-diphosphate-sugar epimerase